MNTIAIACDCDFAITILRLIAQHLILVDAQNNINIMKIYTYISNTLLYVVLFLKIIKIGIVQTVNVSMLLGIILL